MPIASLQYRGVNGCFVSKLYSQDWTQRSGGKGRMNGSRKEKVSFLNSAAWNLFGLIIFLLRIGVVALPLLFWYQNIEQTTPPTAKFIKINQIHPELVLGTFQCLDWQTMVEDVEQQFKYTQLAVCRNPVCNNRSRFMLDINKSR